MAEDSLRCLCPGIFHDRIEELVYDLQTSVVAAGVLKSQFTKYSEVGVTVKRKEISGALM